MGKNKQTQVAVVVSSQISGGGGGGGVGVGMQASLMDQWVVHWEQRDFMHLGSFCAAQPRCAMLLKHTSASNVDDGSIPLLPHT